ncbi:MAG: hypothetical protein JRI23_14905, partial [Deltaproteobacteria bacterium]|nr:hypothetical protein [Deltaproteobacteria bacterium]MBW2533039.1 hypothetical protein [Deltaproteobacteria bacterium]
MLRLVKHLVIIVAFILLASCTGGGCSGCACAGINPLPSGFEAEQRIENAAALRLTDSGLGFLEQNLGALAGQFIGDGSGSGTITFPIPSQNGSFDVIGLALVEYDLCPDGSDETTDPPECIAEIDLAGAQLQIDPEADHNLRIHGPLPVRIQRVPIHLTWLYIFGSDTEMVLNGNGVCPGETQEFADIDLNVNISIAIHPDTDHVRYGYSELEIVDVSLADSDQISDALRFCGGGLDTAILNGLKGVLVPLLVDSLIGQLAAPLSQALCQPANTDLNPPCPEGTENVDGVCRYGTTSDAPCVGIMLGVDGNVDLGDLLASFSPGTSGAFDFVVAAGGHSERDDNTGLHWGDLDPIGAGVTLGMYGGVEARPVSPCVPPSDVPLPMDVPIPDELHQNVLPDWPATLDGPHFGFALSERFFNYALAQMYDSGALCLGVSGAGIPELSSNLLGLGLGAASMTELGRMKEAQEVALVVRPQSPPHVEIGNGTDIESDPLLHLTLDQLAIDFYIWSLDRFVRAMTVTVDVSVPANLMVAPEGLTPVIEAIGLDNAVVTHYGLIREEPALIAAAIEDLVGSLVGGMLEGALPSFDLNGQLQSLGLTLDIPPSVEGEGSPGLRKLTKGSDDYLGLFGTLGLADASPVMQADTYAEIDGYDLGAMGPTRQALRDGTWSDEDLPSATIRLGSSLDDGTRQVEWQYRVDGKPWHPMSTDRFLTLSGHWLLQQGRHVVQIRSRVVGQPYTLDPEPVEVVLTVDDEPPKLRLRPLSDGTVRVEVGDRVSALDALSLRVRFGYGDGDELAWEPWSEWSPADEVELVESADADRVEVEARDEEGNVGVAQQP